MTNEIYVTSKSSKQSINASSDLSNYYSRLSKQWAVSNEIVNNEDYSSKYYAEQTKVIYDDAVNTIGLEKENALNSINNTKLDAILTVEDEGNKQVLLATEQAQIATNKANEIINMADSLANNDLSNLSDLGEKHFLKRNDFSELSGLSAPSGEFIEYTLLASGKSYTAPANGYFYLNKAAGIQNAYATMYTGGIGKQGIGLNTTSNVLVSIYCEKGASCIVNYNATGKTNLFGFIPAKGEIL